MLPNVGAWLTFSNAGSLASLVSLFLTGMVYWNIKEIRRGILYKARAPELLTTLTQHRSTLSTYLTNFAVSVVDYQRQLPALESVLLATEDKVGWFFSKKRRAVRDVRLLVADHRSGQPAQEGAERIYNQLTFLIETLEQDRRDREWQV